jgi:NAD(P)-dependent dehydrogenase (short-subunit alcohol dehydrogenase family)
VTEENWDKAVDINLKGDMAMTKWAMLYWSEKSKQDGKPVKASIVHTTSIGAMANFGNPSYSASKAGVANLGLVAALEGEKYGIRSNVISPGGRTRLTIALQGEERMNRKIGNFDVADPANIAPLIVYLSMEDCPLTGAVFHASGNQIGLFKQWPFVGTREARGRWSVEMLQEMIPELVEGNFDKPSVATSLKSYGAIAAKANAVFET